MFRRTEKEINLKLNDSMEAMKKIVCLFALMLWAMGVIGGIGYCCECHAWVIAVGVAVVGAMSWEQVRKVWKELTE